MKLLLLPLAAFMCAWLPVRLSAETVPVKTSTAAVSSKTAKAAPEAKKEKPPYVKQETYFSLPVISGGKADLADWAGKPVLVVFIASECPYCKRAAPFLESLYSTYKDKGLGVIAVSLDANKDEMAEFAKDYKLTFPIALGGISAARAYRMHGVPDFFLLGKDHKIKLNVPGYDQIFEAPIIAAVEENLK